MRGSAPIDLADTFARYRADLDAALRGSVPSETVAPELYNILRYHLGWVDRDFQPTTTRSGKLLRPTLCLLSCEAVGGNFHVGLPAAAALELLHNFSLIHDDIEDRSSERRGRATVWAVWGEPMAVNAGDALLILSELALFGALARGLTPEQVVSMVEILNRCCLRLTEGQHLDLTIEGNPASTKEEYLGMIAGKTAALLGCSAQLGALAGQAPAEQADRFRRFGENIGLAFQIQDDILGIWGDSRETGKPAADDVYGRKVTLPVIEALSRAPARLADRITTVYRSAAPSAAEVTEVVGYFDELNVREIAEAAVITHVEQAGRELEAAAPVAGPGAKLWSLTQSLVGRKT